MIDMSTRRRNGVIHTFFITNHFFTKIYKVNNPLKQGFRQAIAQEDTGQLYGDEECDLILFFVAQFDYTCFNILFSSFSLDNRISFRFRPALCQFFFSAATLHWSKSLFI